MNAILRVSSSGVFLSKAPVGPSLAKQSPRLRELDCVEDGGPNLFFAGLGAELVQPLLSKEERPVNGTMVLLAAYAGPLAPTRGVPDGMGFVVAPRSRHRAVSVDP